MNLKEETSEVFRDMFSIFPFAYFVTVPIFPLGTLISILSIIKWLKMRSCNKMHDLKRLPFYKIVYSVIVSATTVVSAFTTTESESALVAELHDASASETRIAAQIINFFIVF